MKEQILLIAEALRQGHISPKEAQRELLILFGVNGALAVGTTVFYRGEEMKITSNHEKYNGCAAYRCNHDQEQLFLVEDFENIWR